MRVLETRSPPSLTGSTAIDRDPVPFAARRASVSTSPARLCPNRNVEPTTTRAHAEPVDEHLRETPAATASRCDRRTRRRSTPRSRRSRKGRAAPAACRSAAAPCRGANAPPDDWQTSARPLRQPGLRSSSVRRAISRCPRWKPSKKPIASDERTIALALERVTYAAFTRTLCAARAARRAPRRRRRASATRRARRRGAPSRPRGSGTTRPARKSADPRRSRTIVGNGMMFSGAISARSGSSAISSSVSDFVEHEWSGSFAHERAHVRGNADRGAQIVAERADVRALAARHAQPRYGCPRPVAGFGSSMPSSVRP